MSRVLVETKFIIQLIPHTHTRGTSHVMNSVGKKKEMEGHVQEQNPVSLRYRLQTIKNTLESQRSVD